MTEYNKDLDRYGRDEHEPIVRPFLSVVIPWKDRPELAISLAHNRPIFQSLNAQVIIANCGGDSDLLRRITAEDDLIIDLRLLHGVFNKCYTSNIGAFCSSGARLFFLDADVLLHIDTLPKMLAALEQGSVVTVSRVKECSCEDLDMNKNILSGDINDPESAKVVIQFEVIWPDGSKTLTEDVRIDVATGDCSGPGLALLWRSDFIAIEGYASTFSGWGFEDTDLIIRLQKKFGIRHMKTGTVHHLRHGDEKRVSFGKPLAESSRANISRGLVRYMNGYELGSLFSDVDHWRRAAQNSNE